ncbi:hypothetical protein [Rhodopirellula europaea]|uniref:hypothetical protein n=1 Tax=Rhodopirellula europaea TaxID=1263866 RepID=UPI0011817E7E|nr:hypothetical protein [Rhodopirellula europaea]
MKTFHVATLARYVLVDAADEAADVEDGLLVPQGFRSMQTIFGLAMPSLCWGFLNCSHWGITPVEPFRP